MRWARFLGRLGRTLIGIGVLLLLFVAYQLWGTGLQERRAQQRLADQFEAALATTTTTVSDEGGAEPPRRDEASAPPRPLPGEAVAQIEIPSIDVRRYVVEGVSVADLKQGPGHYPHTPMPGQLGNAAIAGHRTTYGAPFSDLNEVEIGDDIIVRTVQGTFTYVVDGKQVVRPDQVEVLDQTEDARLTLTTCEPRYSARQRLIVTGVLEDEPAPSTAPPVREDDDGGESAAPVTLDDPAGLSGDPAARWPTFWWGLAAVAVALAVWLLARRLHRLLYVPGAAVFLVVLFVFFENVSRLLPATI